MLPYFSTILSNFKACTADYSTVVILNLKEPPILLAPTPNQMQTLPQQCPAQVLFVLEKFSNFAKSRIIQIIFMKNIFYQAPELQLFVVATERGFAQTSNVEDPVIKPDQEW